MLKQKIKDGCIEVLQQATNQISEKDTELLHELIELFSDQSQQLPVFKEVINIIKASNNQRLEILNDIKQITDQKYPNTPETQSFQQEPSHFLSKQSEPYGLPTNIKKPELALTLIEIIKKLKNDLYKQSYIALSLLKIKFNPMDIILPAQAKYVEKVHFVHFNEETEQTNFKDLLTKLKDQKNPVALHIECTYKTNIQAIILANMQTTVVWNFKLFDHEILIQIFHEFFFKTDLEIVFYNELKVKIILSGLFGVEKIDKRPNFKYITHETNYSTMKTTRIKHLEINDFASRVLGLELSKRPVNNRKGSSCLYEELDFATNPSRKESSTIDNETNVDWINAREWKKFLKREGQIKPKYLLGLIRNIWEVLLRIESIVMCHAFYKCLEEQKDRHSFKQAKKKATSKLYHKDAKYLVDRMLDGYFTKQNIPDFKNIDWKLAEGFYYKDILEEAQKEKRWVLTTDIYFACSAHNQNVYLLLE